MPHNPWSRFSAYTNRRPLQAQIWPGWRSLWGSCDDPLDMLHARRAASGEALDEMRLPQGLHPACAIPCNYRKAHSHQEATWISALPRRQAVFRAAQFHSFLSRTRSKSEWLDLYRVSLKSWSYWFFFPPIIYRGWASIRTAYKHEANQKKS